MKDKRWIRMICKYNICCTEKNSWIFHRFPLGNYKLEDRSYPTYPTFSIVKALV